MLRAFIVAEWKKLKKKPKRRKNQNRLKSQNTDLNRSVAGFAHFAWKEAAGVIRKSEKDEKTEKPLKPHIIWRYKLFALKEASGSCGVLNQRVCRRRNMAAEDDAQQSATPVSGEKAPRRAGVPHNR